VDGDVGLLLVSNASRTTNMAHVGRGSAVSEVALISLLLNFTENSIHCTYSLSAQVQTTESSSQLFARSARFGKQEVASQYRNPGAATFSLRRCRDTRRAFCLKALRQVGQPQALRNPVRNVYGSWGPFKSLRPQDDIGPPAQFGVRVSCVLILYEHHEHVQRSFSHCH
jgi:hypothetical protein